MERAESVRLARALVASFLLHLLCFGIYYTGKKMDVWKNLHLPPWSPKFLTQLATPANKTTQKTIQQDLPLVFVQVSPAQSVTEAPKDAKFYSDKNSRAANREADQEKGVPKITGKQNRVIKTEEVAKEEFVPLQPTRPATAKATEEQEEIKAAPKVAPGDLQIAKANPVLKPDQGEAKQPRPRTIRDALARQGITQVPGQKMLQEGGVKRKLQLDSLDAKATPFGAYDNALIEAISDRWHRLLYDRDYATYSSGKVVLRFRLHYDGRISDMRVAENTAGEVLGLICQKAVLDPAPYPFWPSDLRRMAGDIRSLQFTFYYN